MKNYILPIVLFCTVMSCEEENSTRYSIDPQLAQYVDVFYGEASERGVTIPRNLVAELSAHGVQGISKSEVSHDQYYLYFNETMFTNFKAAGLESQIEANVFVRLTEVFMKRNIPYQPSKEAYFDAVFE